MCLSLLLIGLFVFICACQSLQTFIFLSASVNSYSGMVSKHDKQIICADGSLDRAVKMVDRGRENIHNSSFIC